MTKLRIKIFLKIRWII